MYLVVSQWEAQPGRQADFDRVSDQLAAVLRRQPGVEMVEVVQKDGEHVAVHGYRDEATYHKLVDDPGSEFCRALEEYHADDVGHWIRSVRGEARPH